MISETRNGRDEKVLRFELRISWMLRLCVHVSLVLMSLGIIASFALHRDYLSSPGALPALIAPSSAGAPEAGLAAAMKDNAFVALGVLILILTPVLRVALSIGLYARERDRTYVALTSAVLALLLFSFLMGGTH